MIKTYMFDLLTRIDYMAHKIDRKIKYVQKGHNISPTTNRKLLKEQKKGSQIDIYI